MRSVCSYLKVFTFQSGYQVGLGFLNNFLITEICFAPSLARDDSLIGYAQPGPQSETFCLKSSLVTSIRLLPLLQPQAMNNSYAILKG